MPKFGGPGKMKQSCIYRICLNVGLSIILHIHFTKIHFSLYFSFEGLNFVMNRNSLFKKHKVLLSTEAAVFVIRK